MMRRPSLYELLLRTWPGTGWRWKRGPVSVGWIPAAQTAGFAWAWVSVGRLSVSFDPVQTRPGMFGGDPPGPLGRWLRWETGLGYEPLSWDTILDSWDFDVGPVWVVLDYRSDS